MDIGIRLKSLRQQMGLTQKELADRVELSKGFISQLENDAATPSLQTLEEILECLQTDIGRFFSEPSPTQLVFTHTDMETEETEMATVIQLAPGFGRNMTPTKVMLPPGGHSQLEAPHPGEEFAYLMRGSVELTVGERIEQLHAGDAFYFQANAAHYVCNTGQEPAELIWVSAPPNG